MLLLKTSQLLKTMRHLKSFRSCPTSTGRSMWLAEVCRRYREDQALVWREGRSRWLAEAWHRHLRRLKARQVSP